MGAFTRADLETNLKSIHEHLKQGLAALRTDRANPMMVENIAVDYFGSKVPIKQVAAISLPEPRTIAIAPWDKQVIAAVAKAIETSDLGVMPIVSGDTVRINLPPLTDERRHILAREVGERCEERRIEIRKARDEALATLKDAERKKEISEDDFFNKKKEVETLVSDANQELEKIRAGKLQELGVDA